MLLNKMRGRIRELYHCPVQGHGSAQMDDDHRHVCEVVADKASITRTEEKRIWRRLEAEDGD